jgi:hypothetical protein
MTFSPGNAVTWLHQLRGEWGYVWPVDGTVVHVAGRYIVIRVPLRSGELVERRVRPENLRPRTEDQCPTFS